MRKTLIGLVALAATLLPCLGAHAQGLGDYELYITDLNLDYDRGLATGDVAVTAHLPSGQGFVYIPMPFVLTSAGRLLVEPNEGKNLVLFGDYRPAENVSIVQISLVQSPSTVQFRLVDVAVPLGDTAASRVSKTMSLLFGHAHNKAASTIPGLQTPRLASISVNSTSVVFSEPAGRSSTMDTSYRIEFPPSQFTPDDITIYLAEQPNYLLATLIPLAIGLPGGILASVLFVKSRVQALWAVGLGFAALVILVALLVLFGPSLVPYVNTDVLIGFGGIVGLLIGFIASGVYIIRKGPRPLTS